MTYVVSKQSERERERERATKIFVEPSTIPTSELIRYNTRLHLYSDFRFQISLLSPKAEEQVPVLLTHIFLFQSVQLQAISLLRHSLLYPIPTKDVIQAAITTTLRDWAISLPLQHPRVVRRFEVSTIISKKMEVREALISTTELKHRPLTPFRILRGVICLVVLLLTAFMFLVYFGPMAALLLRLVSVHYSRKVTSFLFGLWLALWPFLFEKINKTKVIFSGETVPARERVLLIANHRTEVDWMYLWDLALRKGCSGYIKYVLKSSLMKLPIFGWGFHILEFISVERKWEIDEPVMRQMLSTFTNPADPLWLAVFPEGTDFTEQKCKRSQKFAAESGLPVLNNVLLPKTKGFHACLEILRGSIDAVYDVTIAYKHRCPFFMDNVFGVGPSEVHIHVKRIRLEEIPTLESESASWLIDRFQLKDQLLTDFNAKGHFPCEGTEGQLSTPKCLVNFAVVIGLTGILTYLTFFSSVWFKVYIGLSCAFLASATYLNIRPSPVLGYLKTLLCKGKSL